MTLGALLDVLALTGVAVGLAIVPVLLLWRLPRGWAATLATALVVLAVLPLYGGGLPGQAARVVAFIALPAAWGLRRIPRDALRIAATLASPARVFVGLCLPVALPWIGAGIALGLARVLAGYGFDWLALPPLVVGAWPLARTLAAR